MQTTSSSSSSKAVALFHAAHQDALKLDFGVAEQLLRCNRAAHRRTKYYQRLDMACRCIRKHKILSIYEDYQTLSAQVTEAVERKQKQKKREQIFWEFKQQQDGGSKSGNDEQEMQLLKKRIEDMRKQVSSDLTETIGRLEYASQALFKEMARGFFLSFCTVAVAAIARIRVLLQNLGSQILYEWPAWEKGLIDAFGKEMDPVVVWESKSMKALQLSLLPPKFSSSGGSVHRDQTQELLLAIGVDTQILEGISNDMISDTEVLSDCQTPATQPKSTSIGNESFVDFGERLSSHGATEDDEDAPDYMQAAVNQVQSNLALSKKAKAARQQATSPSSSSKSGRKAGSKKSQNREDDEKDEGNLASAKQKKKKRKDSSKTKSAKKAKKSSGEFFDNLFK